MTQIPLSPQVNSNVYAINNPTNPSSPSGQRALSENLAKATALDAEGNLLKNVAFLLNKMQEEVPGTGTGVSISQSSEAISVRERSNIQIPSSRNIQRSNSTTSVNQLDPFGRAVQKINTNTTTKGGIDLQFLQAIYEMNGIHLQLGPLDGPGQKVKNYYQRLYAGEIAEISTPNREHAYYGPPAYKEKVVVENIKNQKPIKAPTEIQQENEINQINAQLLNSQKI